MTKTPTQIDANMAKSWVHCPRRAWYDVFPPEGFEPTLDPFENLVMEQGIAHEQRILNSFPEYALANSEEHTKDLMKQAVSVIYQPSFSDPELNIVGRPDFLILRENGKYQIADAKLASSLRGHPEIKVQLGIYLKLLDTDLPALVYLGNESIEEVGSEAIPLADEFLTDMRRNLKSSDPPVATFSDSKCKSCPYDPICRPEFRSMQELTLAPGVNARSAEGLRAQGITTLSELAEADPAAIKDIPYLGGLDKKQHAVSQAKSLLKQEIYQLAPLKLRPGTWVHFDVESNPLADDASVYLWGWLEPPYDRQSFQYTWSDGSPESDRTAWDTFLEHLEQLRAKYSDLVVVHFSNYEVTQIRAYSEKYEMANHPTVQWLLGENSPLFDLLPPIKEALVLPLESYGLKTICKHENLVNFKWELEESGSQWSVVRYMDYLGSCDHSEKERIRNEILSYNRDDVRATRALEIWLRENYDISERS